MTDSTEVTALLRALLTAQVVAHAQAIFSLAQMTAQPSWVTVERGEGFEKAENINPNSRKSWEQCLKEAADQIAEEQPAVIALLQARGVLPR